MNRRKTATMDGNTAAAHVSYAFTEVATIFPITPSSVMAELIDAWSTEGRKNIFGNQVVVRQMQSEAGACGAMHGVLQGGALCSTYTASQGLMLMHPVIHRIAGELLPGVFHVAARCLGSNTLSIYGDHQDVMNVRATGAVMLASSTVQECMDLGAVAHLTAIHSRLPVVHFFDGFRTSHEIQKIELLEYDELAGLADWDAIRAFRDHASNPDHPLLHGVTQNPDMFFQLRESVNRFYQEVPQTVQKYMDEISALTGKHYRLFEYYGAEDAEYVLVAMGSGCSVIRETIDYWNARGKKYGLVNVHLYRPFSNADLIAAVPQTAKRIAVLDRTKEPGADSEPLLLDVRNAFYGREHAPVIVGGRFGLSSKEFAPRDALSVFENLERENPKDHFTVGITDDVTFLSLPTAEEVFDSAPATLKACRFWGYGSDGTVGANKSAIKIIGNHTDKFVQAYFAYDAKKSGGLTVSHLRFGDEPIYSSYQVNHADFIACHNQAYVNSYDLTEGLKEGGTFLLNCTWSDDELEEALPADLKRKLAEKHAKFYTINAVEIASRLGLGGRINMIMQAAFFRLAEIIPEEDALRYLKEEAEKSYGKSGQKVVEMNFAAIDEGASAVHRVAVPDHWAEAKDRCTDKPDYPEFYRNIVLPSVAQQGDRLPVSAFRGWEDGAFPMGTSEYEKRGISLRVPRWEAEKCLQCNLCAMSCPHSVIRPLLLDAETAEKAPRGVQKAEAKGFAGKQFHLALSILDCTGCGICEDVCPAQEKAIRIGEVGEDREERVEAWNYVKNYENDGIGEKLRRTVKGSQFLRPLLEFPGACAGCGETPYAKLVTQLFGDRLQFANTAGCSVVWSASSPSIAYRTNNAGHGPAFLYSLFENDAELGYGAYLGSKTVRNSLKDQVIAALETPLREELRGPMQEWLEGFDRSAGTRERADRLAAALEPYRDRPGLKEIYERRDFMVRRSYWIFGGDGWAYDIGFGGLDHVLATGENINVFVFDTEVYSNTGGQSSKATQKGAVAKFAAGGKVTRKKDLGRIAMSYGNIYVASVCFGADRAQTLRAFVEAEEYEGPSLIIGYAPCINHGIRAGMGTSQHQQKLAVETGYWMLYRYNPDLAAEGKNPMILDSKKPSRPLAEMMSTETRFLTLQKNFPEKAERLAAEAQRDADERYRYYKYLSENAL